VGRTGYLGKDAYRVHLPVNLKVARAIRKGVLLFLLVPGGDVPEVTSEQDASREKQNRTLKT
jgi:hypothetical protein